MILGKALQLESLGPSKKVHLGTSSCHKGWSNSRQGQGFGLLSETSRQSVNCTQPAV